ncbi:hypothetical protein GOB57_23935 [Sinorhizobium meliloti]|nr:hypothetical protein [Sinorhizobium meliloti]
MTDERKRHRAFTLLSSLPEVIETRDVRIAAGWEKKTAVETMFRWVRAGYIVPFATGVYFNLVASPKAPQTHVFEAAQRTIRRPMILIGASALRAAGWTTQMPSGYELAIVTDRNIRTWKSMSGIAAEARSVKWFARVMPFAIKGESTFDRLPPALALVDSIVSAERFAALPKETQKQHLENATVTWHPDPDDICVPVDREPEDVWKEIVEAAELLGVPFETVRAYAVGIPDLEDVVSAAHPPQRKPGR